MVNLVPSGWPGNSGDWNIELKAEQPPRVPPPRVYLPPPRAKKIAFKPGTQEATVGIEAHGDANMYLDTIDVEFESGVVQSHSIALIETESQILAYPGGGLYPFFAGCLSLGATDPQQIFTGTPSVNATIIP